MGVWIAVVIATAETEAKLAAKHGVSMGEVTEAVTLGKARQARWHDHRAYGRRLLVRGVTAQGRELMVTLKPIDETDGTWECKTAWPWRKR